jgi:hypothetical protein
MAQERDGSWAVSIWNKGDVMTTRKKFSTPKPVKSDLEIISERAIKQQDKHPERIEQIEQIVRKFRILDESSEIPDRSAAIQQCATQIESICARRPAFTKSSDGDKRPPLDKSIKISNHTGTKATPKKKKKGSVRKRLLLQK